MNEQIELDKLSAIESIKNYLNNFMIPERGNILEDLICELDKEGVINVDWVEIY